MPKLSAYDLHRAELAPLVVNFTAGGSADADSAALNLTNRQPAFWTKAGHGNALAGELLTYSNLCADVCNGILRYSIEYGEHARDIDEERYLDTLVPLNDAGALSLQEAYELRCNTFKSRAELLKRQRDIGFRAQTSEAA